MDNDSFHRWIKKNPTATLEEVWEGCRRTLSESIGEHEYECQQNPGIQCEACVRDNVSGEIERRVHG